MEIKYEAIFGDQELFDGFMDDCEFTDGNYGFKVANACIAYCERYNQKFGWSPIRCAKQIDVIAMRRIIRTPTWTVADQKAGKLPEVGAMLNHKTQGECTFIGYGVNDKSRWALKLKNDLIYIADKNWCTPIESPEEKAARLREEWCSNALGSASILSGMQEYELKRLGGYIGNIYDALLSGELPVPVKGE